MATYRRVMSTSENQALRCYTITAGLREGFGDEGMVFSIEDAKDVILRWIEERLGRGQAYLSGTIGAVEVLYGIGEGANAAGRCEPAVTYTGFVSVRRTPVPSDEEVESMLDELAARLGTALRQVRVNIEYRGRTWVLEESE